VNRDIATLPKWAQNEIARLESDVEHWKVKATAGPANSDTFVTNYKADKPLGSSPQIKFQVGENNHQCIEAKIVNGELRVSAPWGGSLLVVPNCSNVVSLRLGDR
jgi:hypothetical protein